MEWREYDVPGLKAKTYRAQNWPPSDQLPHGQSYIVVQKGPGQWSTLCSFLGKSERIGVSLTDSAARALAERHAKVFDPRRSAKARKITLN